LFHGTTREEVVNYYLTVPSDSVQGAVQFLAAAVTSPIFPEDELAREKEVVLGEYDRQESNPFFGLNAAMGQKLYPGQWSRKNTIGDRRVLRSVTRAQMEEIRRRYYVPNNTALIVAGDVNPARVFAMAERAFGDWKRAPDPFVEAPIPTIPPLARSEAVIAESPVGAVTVLVQWQGPSVGKDPEATYAADVFSDALNLPNSAFQRRLVDSGLWQGVGVNYYTLNNVGPITISGQTTPEKLREALAALYAEIEKLDDPGYFSAEVLEQVKAHRAVDSAFGRERTSGFAHTIGFWWSVASLEYYMGYVDNMAQSTPRDLQAYAQRYIVGKPHVTGALIHPDARRALRLTEADLLREGVKP
jgi:zinc protease